MSTGTPSGSEPKTRSWHASAALAARVIGGVLSIAAGLKIFDLFDSYGEGVLWLLALVGALLELLVGVSLLLRVWPRVSVPVGGLLFVLMAGVSVVAISRSATRCGCLGAVPMSPWVVFFFDVAAATALLWRPWAADASQDRQRQQLAAACIAALFLGVALGTFLYPKFRPITVNLSVDVIRKSRTFEIDPRRFLDREFYLIPFIDIDANLAEGEWKVILTRPRCRKCDRMLGSGGCQPVGNECIAVILVDDKTGSSGAPWTLPEGCKAVLGHLQPGKTWNFDPPLTFRVANNKVIETR
jgi:hypothetical protein